MQQRLKAFLKALHINESTISTLLGGLVVVIVAVLIFNYFKQASQPEQISEEAASVESQKIGEVAVEEQEDGKLVPKQLPQVYEVKPGDHLWKIAEAHYGSGYNWVDIATENNLASPDYLMVGQTLTLPKTEVRLPAIQDSAKASITESVYTVQKGDNVWEIAVRAYGDGYRWPEIAQANNLANSDQVEVGQELQIPRK